MKVILDVMGGDLAPEAAVLGALEAHREFGTEITLVGRGEEILGVMRKHNIQDLPKGMEIANADDVVNMHDDPTSVIHKRKNSSMIVGLKMLADGQADAFISAGNTGALLTGGTLLVKRVKGIRRAAFGPVMPNQAGGSTLIIDSGANVECTPEFLLQFGVVGSEFMKKSCGLQNPRVGLLNNGTEETKGPDLQKQAYALLKQAHEADILNFIGNIEGRDVVQGDVDVVVCDGFSGNILLKSIEGTAMFMGSLMKRMFQRNSGSKLGYLLCRSGVKEITGMLDYREVGGTPLLGLRKPVIKAHGSSDARAFRSAIYQAVAAAERNIAPELEAAVQRLTALKENSVHD